MSEPNVEEIVNAEVTQETLEQWYKFQKQLEILKLQEMQLRQRIFGHYFPNPKEGTNTYALPHGWALKGTYKINRKIDLALYANHKQEFVKMNIPLDELVEYKPELKIGVYNSLTEDQKKAFDAVLESKPGSPSMEIVLPKRK